MWPWLEFAAAAAAILFVSDRLSAAADVLAERLGVGHAFIGVVLLGAVTSLPELITSLASITLIGSADLAVGNIFGSNLFNVLIIAVMDFFFRERSFDSGNVLTANLSTLVALVAITGLMFGGDAGGVGHVSMFSIAVAGLYLLSMRALYSHDQGNRLEDEMGDPLGEEPSRGPLGPVVVTTALSAAGVIVAGIVATHAVGDIAQQYDLGESFAGGLFLAAATSLPELVVCLSAVRMGSTTMAAGNVFGSNLFNLAILPIADLVLADQLFGSVAPRPHLLLALGGLVLTALAVYGILMGKGRQRVGRVGVESLGIIACYLLAMWSNFRVS